MQNSENLQYLNVRIQAIKKNPNIRLLQEDPENKLALRIKNEAQRVACMFLTEILNAPGPDIQGGVLELITYTNPETLEGEKIQLSHTLTSSPAEKPQVQVAHPLDDDIDDATVREFPSALALELNQKREDAQPESEVDHIAVIAQTIIDNITNFKELRIKQK